MIMTPAGTGRPVAGRGRGPTCVRSANAAWPGQDRGFADPGPPDSEFHDDY